MKTAMQELITTYNKLGYLQFDNWLANHEKRLLKKEKEQIIDFAYGCVQHISREDIEQYYNKLYNQMPKL